MVCDKEVQASANAVSMKKDEQSNKHTVARGKCQNNRSVRLIEEGRRPRSRNRRASAAWDVYKRQNKYVVCRKEVQPSARPVTMKKHQPSTKRTLPSGKSPDNRSMRGRDDSPRLLSRTQTARVIRGQNILLI